MIEKIIRYQAVCDRCGRHCGEDEGEYPDSDDAEEYALDGGWQWIDRKLYCPECAAKLKEDEL